MRRLRKKGGVAGRPAGVRPRAPAVVLKSGSGLAVTTKGRYGLRLMIELARQASAQAVTLGDLARRLKVSEKYLWHVARLLAAAKLLQAERGAHGGYRLARVPENITMVEMVEALEGPCQLVPAAEHGQGPAGFAWREVETALRQKLQSLRLRAILDLHAAHAGALSYVI